MSEIAAGMWVLALLVAVVGVIPYAIWIIVSLVRKKWSWKRACLQVAFPVVVFAALWLLQGPLAEKAYSDYLVGLFDTKAKLGRTSYEYASPRSFNGDGYTISVYDLPDSVRRRFQNADQRLLQEFPKRPRYRSHWRTEHWREAPFDPALQKYLDFALSSYDANQAESLSAQFDAIREALAHKRTFYGFFTFDHGDYPGDIDLFIVDLERGRLYMINHNT